MATEATLKVNQEKLVNHLRFSFTDPATVLGELMQNSRRAGASQVWIEFDPEAKTLTVKDDGCGIDSFQTLLTVAESGWDAQTVEQEHPFGIGFLSALFASGHLTVESRGQRIAMATSDILAFKPVAVTPVIRCPEQPRFEGDACGCGSEDLIGPDHEGVYDCPECGLFFTAEAAASPSPQGTRVRLEGFKPDAAKVANRLAELAMGFPIPVLFNGEALKRPFALDAGLEFVETPLGRMHLKGFGEGEDWTSPVTNLLVYLQGLPVYHSPCSWFRHEGSHVVHLDSARFRARLPDRDKLVDEHAVIREVEKALKQAVACKLEGLKTSLPPAQFAKGYPTLRQWDCLDLLNDIPVVPAQALSFIQQYPVKEGAWHDNTDRSGAASREDIESGKVVVAALDCFCEENARQWMYAWHKNLLVYDQPLHSGHWLHGFLVELDKQDVELEIVGETHRAYFDGQWVCGEAVFCEKYRLVFGGDTVEIQGDAIYLEDEGRFIVPAGDACGSVVGQASSYLDEHDTLNQAVKDEDEWAFSKFVIANTSANPAKALERLLPSFSGCPKVFGRRFAIELDAAGLVTQVAEQMADEVQVFKVLLQECLWVLNEIPNRRIKRGTAANTYGLASKVEAALAPQAEASVAEG